MEYRTERGSERRQPTLHSSSSLKTIASLALNGVRLLLKKFLTVDGLLAQGRSK